MSTMIKQKASELVKQVLETKSKSIKENSSIDYYAEGDKVTFTIGDNDPEDFNVGEGADFLEKLQDHSGSIATITGVAIEPVIVKETGYYDIKFDDGFELEAVSGYNLIPA